jgi:hypothetical protein
VLHSLIEKAGPSGPAPRVQGIFKVKEKAMKKLLIAGVLGAVVMVTGLGTQAASAAVWRGGFRGHAYAHPAYRTALVRPHFYGRYAGPVYDRCR